MRLNLHLAGLLLTLAVSLPAEQPLGTLASRGPVTLSGVELPMAGIPRWPIASGDVLATGEAPAWILLNDRSRLAVHSNSLIRFEDVGGELNVTVLKGFFEADLRPGSRVKVDAPGSQADADPEQSQERKGLRLPLRARSRFDLHGLPPGTRRRSPNSPCAADPSLPPPNRSLCSAAGGAARPGRGRP